MTLLSLSRQIRTALERQDAAEFKRLGSSYQDMVDRLEGDIDALSKDIAEGEFTPRSVQYTDSYRRLMKDAERELGDYQDSLLDELEIASQLWLGLGVSNSDSLISQAFTDEGIEQEIVSLDDNVIAALNVYLAPGSPLYKRLMMYGKTATERIKQIILESVTKGLGPRELARLIVADGFGMGLTDALRMARTLQLYAYRDATLANYRQYAGIIKGWVWSSALIPGRTCMSCVNMHGSIHTLKERLNDHHNGICAMLPYLGTNPIKETGETWFTRQPNSVQVQMMGQTKWDAWNDGRFSFVELTTESDDPVYGPMRHERSLKEILGE